MPSKQGRRRIYIIIPYRKDNSYIENEVGSHIERREPVRSKDKHCHLLFLDCVSNTVSTSIHVHVQYLELFLMSDTLEHISLASAPQRPLSQDNVCIRRIVITLSPSNSSTMELKTVESEPRFQLYRFIADDKPGDFMLFIEISHTSPVRSMLIQVK